MEGGRERRGREATKERVEREGGRKDRKEERELLQDFISESSIQCYENSAYRLREYVSNRGIIWSNE